MDIDTNLEVPPGSVMLPTISTYSSKKEAGVRSLGFICCGIQKFFVVINNVTIILHQYSDSVYLHGVASSPAVGALPLHDH